MSDERPLSEVLNSLANYLTIQRYPEPGDLWDASDRAAALEREVEELREAMVPRAALEYMAECWARYDPGEINPDEAIAYALKHAEDAALKSAEGGDGRWNLRPASA